MVCHIPLVLKVNSLIHSSATSERKNEEQEHRTDWIIMSNKHMLVHDFSHITTSDSLVNADFNHALGLFHLLESKVSRIETCVLLAVTSPLKPVGWELGYQNLIVLAHSGTVVSMFAPTKKKIVCSNPASTTWKNVIKPNSNNLFSSEKRASLVPGNSDKIMTPITEYVTAAVERGEREREKISP